MAKEIKPTKKDSPAIHHGKISGNLPAESYAKPHTMTGKAVTAKENPGEGPNRSKLDDYDVSLGAVSKSAGNEPTKTSGVKIRGTGAATKGLMARGPMA
jgi:hypothetical protein